MKVCSCSCRWNVFTRLNSLRSGDNYFIQIISQLYKETQDAFQLGSTAYIESTQVYIEKSGMSQNAY